MRDATLGRFDPLGLRASPLAVKVLAVALGTAFLATSSHVQVPMWPVPITMQSFAVAIIGAFYGWRLGAITVAAWLAEAAAGLPVLSAPSNLAYFFGPTGGYLFAYPIVAALTGWLVARGWDAGRPVLAFAAFLIANLVCLALGAAWLAQLIGVEKAIAAGVTPFLIGDALKSALGAATLVGFDKMSRSRR